MKGARKKPRELVLEGRLTIDRGEDIRKSLLDAINKRGDLEIRFLHVTEADLSLLQMLCSASVSARIKGASLRIRDEVMPFAVSSALEASGLKNHRGCPDEGCIWPGPQDQCKGVTENG